MKPTAAASALSILLLIHGPLFGEEPTPKKSFGPPGGGQPMQVFFDLLDADEDGFLTGDEIPVRARSRLEVVDLDSDGKISREEFATAARRFAMTRMRGEPEDARPPAGEKPKPEKGKEGDEKGSRPEITPERLLQRFDTDQDGKLAESEVPEFLWRRLSQLDKDESKSVDATELKDLGSVLAGFQVPRSRELPPKASKENDKDSDAPGEKKMKREQVRAMKKGKGAKNADAKAGLDPEALFKRLDANGDGKLTVDELPDRMKENLERLDRDRDGAVSKEELGVLQRFLRARAEQEKGSRTAGRTPLQLFNDQDADADGRLTREEAKGKFASEFDRLDTNKDGKLDRHEVEAIATPNENEKAKAK